MSGSDTNFLMHVGLGPGSDTALSDTGRPRTEKFGPIRTLPFYMHSQTFLENKDPKTLSTMDPIYSQNPFISTPTSKHISVSGALFNATSKPLIEIQHIAYRDPA